MKALKHSLVLFISAVMLITTFAACGGNSDTSTLRYPDSETETPNVVDKQSDDKNETSVLEFEDEEDSDKTETVTYMRENIIGGGRKDDDETTLIEFKSDGTYIFTWNDSALTWTGRYKIETINTITTTDDDVPGEEDEYRCVVSGDDLEIHGIMSGKYTRIK